MAEVPFELEGVEPLKLLGTGGFGEVWLALQTNIDRKVAVKVGHAPIEDATIQIRFERECIALGRLSGHPNIVDVFTAGQLDDGRPYLMLEYVSGGTLWQRLNRQELSETDLSKIGVELAAALSVAHTAGVLHRDLKPENVLLRPTGEAVLGDFGIARLHDADNTISQAITASVAYAAPEVLSGKPASMASDLYGIGICLLSAGTRAVPFLKRSDESVHPIINRVLTDRPPDLSERGYSEGFAEIVKSLLQKKPEDRPLSAEVVHELLIPFTLPANANLLPTTSDKHIVPAPAEDSAATGEHAVLRVSQRLQPVPGSRSFRSAGSLAADLEPEADVRKRQQPRTSDETIRLLGAVVGAILLIGGLAVFALNRFTDFSFPGTSDESTAETDAPVATTTTSSTAPTTEAPPPEPPPLALPLGVADTELGIGTRIEADLVGPDSSQFCDVTPTTIGLIDWEGETLRDPVGYPLLFQQMARFESIDEASSYVKSYLPSSPCDWTLPGPDGSPVVILQPASVRPPTAYGDENGEVAFSGVSGTTELHGRVAIVRSGTDVYTLSINSFIASDLNDLDGLLTVAIRRLGF